MHVIGIGKFIFNYWLYIMYIMMTYQGNPQATQFYKNAVKSGMPCYQFQEGGGSESPYNMPVCWYDPSNRNWGKMGEIYYIGPIGN